MPVVIHLSQKAAPVPNTDNAHVMQSLSIPIAGHQASLNVWAGAPAHLDTTPIHFAHANGFTAGVYRQMLGELSKSRTIYALGHRATWQDARQTPEQSFDWTRAADDLIAGLEHIRTLNPKVRQFIGVGHSLGAVTTLIAAKKRPDLFEKLIVIEPVLLQSASLWMLKMMPFAMRHRYLSLPKMTLRRRDVWDSHERFVDFHAAKSAFGGIDRAVMQDYAEHGLRTRGQDEAFELVFPKAWEAHVFATLPDVWGVVRSLTVPCTCIRGSDSARWVPVRSWDKWQKLRPDYPLLTLENMGHLAPLQQPQAVAQLLSTLL